MEIKINRLDALTLIEDRMSSMMEPLVQNKTQVDPITSDPALNINFKDGQSIAVNDVISLMRLYFFLACLAKDELGESDIDNLSAKQAMELYSALNDAEKRDKSLCDALFKKLMAKK